ncbi:MAG: APC family permease [Actinobacteria bacterium]|nr:APC family permease [Actinomycetota bacterium]
MSEQAVSGAGSVPGGRGLFVRRSSGLIREFRASDVFIFNTIGYAPGIVFAVVPTFVAALWPEQNVLLIVTVGTLFTLFNAVMYGYLAAAMPRSGGDYIYLSRVTHPALGFTANWGFTWSQFLGLALYAAFTVNFGVAVALATLGNATGNDTLISWSNSVSGPWPTFLIGLALLVTVLAVLSLPARVIRRIFLVGFIPAIIGSFVTIGVLFTTSKQEFINRFDAFMAERGGGQTYQGIIERASDAGFSAGDATFIGALLAIPIGYWIYIGFTYSAYIGGEVKQASKTQPRMILATLGFAYLIYMLAFWRYYDVVGKEFTNSVVYVDGNTDEGSGIPVSPVMNFFAGIMTDSTILNVLIGLSFILWHVLLLFVIGMICTRNLFAWSFDSLMPPQLATVGRKTHAPWVAAIVIAAIATVLLALYVFTSFFTIVVNYIVIFSVAFLLVSFAGILLPYRRPEIFNQAPETARRRLGSIPVITLVGIGNLILFTLILIASFKTPAFSGPTGGRAIVFVVAIYVVGAAVYFLARTVQRRRGVNVDLLYREIPPE